ncbi:DNA mismatch repair endonuclease MutL [Liquorilactobacillus mali]|uniref:DNA mismatch repair endonuclease MutL n=1 Tax=Liquorilactobacillus mali TaxID=1618 RepID=UPI0002490EBE|nr:DNA mismatch repair endonuclease MutL [Liquorilactobacillus mali]EJF00718.1 DNA mismatch repair protein [Liquorilactobacillus mali KCTC 3596 = DSM 20444]QFQ74307.1 DNA mismatch repair endonuclease MutL [Liquorilactobacillus mali]
MGKIHELTDILADQIAAGEVVERPASVVKELVENAIDANSSQIDILVEEGGLAKIQVIDNGEGIEDSDVELAFKRHSTSKILTKKDLFKIRTLGFRGEALPSIASVAEVELETAAKNAAGTAIKIKGGQILEKKMAARSQGTTITVADLFFNTPARLKYLKSIQTELAAISDIVNRLALSNTNIAFSFSSNGKTLLQTAGNGNLQQTISAIYGVNNARKMLAFTNEDLDFKISGFVSLPELTRASKNYISILINGRYIKNYQLTNAIIKGYGSKLMVGRYPFAVLAISLDPLLIDVNVHPTKQEVRISKEEQLGGLIRESIAQRIAPENLIPDALKNLEKKEKSAVDLKQLEIDLNESSRLYQTKNEPPVSSQENKTTTGYGDASDKVNEKTQVDKESIPDVFVVEKRADLTTNLAAWDEKYGNEGSTEQDNTHFPVNQADLDEQKTKKRFPDLVYIGQMHGTYLFAQSDDGFYIVDQHAAQERCKYEYYRKKIGEVGTGQQSLLVPIVLDYSTSDVLLINQNLDKLATVGINLEEFGRNSYIVHQHPTWFKAGQEESILRELIDYILKDGKIDIAAYREKTAIMMSCKRSIKANHHLDDLQAKALLEELKNCENPFNCPHGRPVLVHFSNSDMEHMFKRIQDSHQSQRSLD